MVLFSDDYKMLLKESKLYNGMRMISVSLCDNKSDGKYEIIMVEFHFNYNTIIVVIYRRLMW